MSFDGDTKKKKRVAAFLNYPAHYTDAVLEKLAEDDRIELDIIYYNESPTDHTEWKREISKNNHIYYCKKKYTLFRGEYYNPEAIKWFKKGNYDVAIISGRMPFTSAHLLRICRRKKIPYIFAADTAVLPIDADIEHIEKERKKYGIIVQNAIGIWVPGKAGRAYWNRLFGDAIDQKIVEGRYLLDREHIIQHFSATESRRIIREELGVDEQDPLFLFVGALEKKRNVSLLLRAAEQIIAMHSNYRFLIVGYGEDEKIVKEYENKYSQNIFHIKSVPYDELNDYYLASDVYVHPGREPYSLALVQAVLDGLTVITTDAVGAAYDYVIDGKNGYVISSDCHNSLVSALNGILEVTFSKGEQDRIQSILDERDSYIYASDIRRIIEEKC